MVWPRDNTGHDLAEGARDGRITLGSHSSAVIWSRGEGPTTMNSHGAVFETFFD